MYKEQKKPSVWKFHLLMILNTGLVSTSFTASKSISLTLAPELLTLLRFTFAALLFLPVLYVRYGTIRLPRARELGQYALISGVLVSFFYLMFASLRITSAINTSAIFTIVPGLSCLYSWILLRENLGLTKLLSLIPAAFGALWIIYQGKPYLAFSLQPNMGDLLFFLACLLMGLYPPLIKFFHSGEPMEKMTFWILVTGCLWLILFALLDPKNLIETRWDTISSSTWLGIMYLALFCTMITFFLGQWCTLYLGPSRVMAYSFLYPPGTLMVEWILGHPLPGQETFFGMLFILPALFIIQYSPRKQR